MGSSISTIRSAWTYKKLRPENVSYIQLRGDGMQGLMLLGACEYVRKSAGNVKGLVGTSSGAVIALLIALGVTYGRTIDIFMKFVHCDMFGPASISRTELDWSVHSMSKMRSTATELLNSHGFSEDVTLGDFSARCHLDLRIVITPQNSTEVVVLSADTTPQVSVLDAILAASASPVFFEPQHIRGLDGMFTNCVHHDTLPDQWPHHKHKTLHILINPKLLHNTNRLSSNDGIHHRTLVMLFQNGHSTTTNPRRSIHVHRGRTAAAKHFSTRSIIRNARTMARRSTIARHNRVH